MLLEGIGLNSAFANPATPVAEMPEPQPVGTVHQIGLADDAQRLILLEAPFDYGRSLLLRAAAVNRAEGYVFPLEVRLYSHWLWGSKADGLPWPPKRPDARSSASPLWRETDRLLGHLAFEGWFAQSDALYRAAEALAAGTTGDSWRLVQRLARQHFAEPSEVARYRHRLAAMAEWLVLAGDTLAAQLARAAADALETVSPVEIPFALALVRRGLEIAIYNLRHSTGADTPLPAPTVEPVGQPGSNVE
jgi:hypothetical protein